MSQGVLYVPIATDIMQSGFADLGFYGIFWRQIFAYISTFKYKNAQKYSQKVIGKAYD